MKFEFWQKLDALLSSEDIAKRDELITQLSLNYQNYSDPWGFDIDIATMAIKLIYPLYKNYFKVKVFGEKNIPDGPCMIVANHTGQLPIDGMLLTLAYALHTNPPKVLHGMVERFLAALPFLGQWSAGTGAVLGDRENCLYLLEKGESILAFPEGVRGIAKNTSQHYQLQSFSTGFYRLAIAAKIPVVPVTIVGAEEMYPLVYHLKGVGKKLGLPTLPLSANLLPLPGHIDISFGEAILPPNDLISESPENELRPHIQEIEDVIKKELNLRLSHPRGTMRKLTHFMRSSK